MTELSPESIVPYDKEKHQVFLRHMLSRLPEDFLNSGNSLDDRIENTIAIIENKQSIFMLDKKQESYVKFVNNLPVGFIHYQAFFPTWIDFYSTRPNLTADAYLHYFVINPHYHNKGYEKELLNIVVEKFQKDMASNKYWESGKLCIDIPHTSDNSSYQDIGFKIKKECPNSKTYVMHFDKKQN